MLHASPSDFVMLPAFAKITCEPEWKWAKRDKALESYDLFYVWDGEGEVILNESVYPVGKGSCFLFRPGDRTSATHERQRPLILTYIHFRLADESEPACTDIPAPYRKLEDPMELELLLSRYVRLNLEGGYGAEEEARLVLKQLMIRLLREDRDRRERSGPSAAHSRSLAEAIRETANYIRQNPAKAHKLEELAVRAHLSPRYYSLKFKELIGVPVQTYMIQVRIERAIHLLQYAGMTVSEVADALGYRDLFFFSRQFKRYTGKSPSEMR